MKNIVRKIMPKWALERYRLLRLVSRAGSLRRTAEGTHEVAHWVDLVLGEQFFRPLQIKEEIVAVLDQVRRLEPLAVLEIGSALGGTAFLFSRVASPRATIILIDRELEPQRCSALRHLMQPGQRMVCFRDDSHDPTVPARVQAALEGSPVDFLFIDGDHSYDGVSMDFRSYSPLVREGGLIAFHDIVPDHGRRFGRQPSGYAGDVFKFWRELKQRYGTQTTEFIHDPDQDGAGIGMMRWKPNDTSHRSAG